MLITYFTQGPETHHDAGGDDWTYQTKWTYAEVIGEQTTITTSAGTARERKFSNCHCRQKPT